MTPPLVGRERQLGRLRQLWEEAQAGNPGVALLVGEAGSGKTRITSQLISEVSERGGLVVRGECLPLGGHDLPYGPFLGVLDDMLAVPAVAEPLRQELSALLAAVETAPNLAGVDTSARQGGHTQRGRLFQQFLRAVTELSSQFPVLLALEDVHWADRSSLDLLAFLVAGLRRQQLLLLVTARNDEAGGDSTAELLTELRRRGSATALSLPPLDDASMLALLDDGSPLPRDVRGEITRRADGNPFYALELKMAWEGGVRTLPDEVADAALSRLRGLSGDAVELLRPAAAIGRKFTDDLLEAVLDLSEDRRLTALRELLDRGALVPEGDAYRFRHALLQEAVYTRLVPGERRRVHRAVAPALQQIADRHGLDLETAVALSFHWRAAADPAAALSAVVTAETLARRAHAYGEAAQQAEAAVALWDDVTDRPPGLRLLALLIQAAEDRRWAGDLSRALAHARRAAHLAATADHSPAEQATALEKLGQLIWADGDLAGALVLHEQAATIARRQGMTAVTARTLASWAARLTAAGAFLHAASVAQEAAEAAQELGLAAVEANALTMWGTSQAVLGELDAGLERLQRARELARSTADPEELLRVHTNHAFVLLEAGRPAEAADAATEGIAELIGLDVPRTMLPMLITNLAVAHWRAGRWTEARAVAETGLSDWAPLDRQYLQALLVELQVNRGDTASARELLEEMVRAGVNVTDVRITMWRRSLEMQLALLDGRARDALSVAAEAVRDLPVVGLHASALRLCAVCARVLTHVRDHRLEAAAGVEVASVASAITEVLLAHQAIPDRSSLQEQALLAECEAELDRAEARTPGMLWAVAARAWRAAAQPYDVAHAVVRQAEDLAAARRRREAADLLDEVEPLLFRLGAAPLLRRVGELRDAIRVDPSPMRQQREATADPVTALGITNRERQVLDLLMRGKTNRQIGRALGTTERTAGTHVSNLLRKLGVASRVEAVSLAHRLLGSGGHRSAH